LLIAVALLIVPCPLASQEDTLTSVLRRWEQIELVVRELGVVGEASFRVRWGEVRDPPLVSRFEYRSRDGRVLEAVRGFELEDRERTEPPLRLSLFLSGDTEVLDLSAGQWKKDPLQYPDPYRRSSSYGPNDFLWACTGNTYLRIARSRPTDLLDVQGTSPRRVVLIGANNPSGRQRFRFRCREEWGWVPDRVTMSVREGDAWKEIYRAEVLDVHPTRLVCFPKRARMWFLGSGTDRPYTSAEYVFEAPTFSDIQVPGTLASVVPAELGLDDGLAPERAAGSDVLLRGVRERGEFFLDLARRVAPGHDQPADGLLKPWLCRPYVGLVLVMGLLALAIVVAMRSPRWGALAGLLLVPLVLLSLAGVPADRFTREAYFELVSADLCEEVPGALRSDRLCGVDGLFVLLNSLGGYGEDDPDAYRRLLALVGPGRHGTTLEALSIAAECLDVSLRVVDPRYYESPPIPMIAHLPVGHFVVVTGAGDAGDVHLLDPALGACSVSWAELRRMVSGRALVSGGPTTQWSQP